jgi:hypothetical protein
MESILNWKSSNKLQSLAIQCTALAKPGVATQHQK